MLTIHNLSCIRHQQPLFSALNFTLHPTEILHVIGANGSGKSSLLHILTGLLLPQSGEVYWQGVPVTDRSSDYYAQLSYVGHKAGVKHELTVLENLQLSAALSAGQKQHDWEAVLAHFGLQDLRHTVCHRLSAGQKQRVALTRLLLTAVPLWILDEPFTALDAQTTGILQQLLLQHTQEGRLVILTSHHPLEWVAAKQVVL